MKDNKYIMTFDALQDKWRCSKPGHHHCYLPKGEQGQHFKLLPREWGNWATAIVNKQGVFEYPPRMPEFDHILDKKSKSGKGKHRSHESESESDRSKIEPMSQALRLIEKFTTSEQPSQLAIQPNTYRSARRHSDPYSSPVKTRKRATTVSATRLLAKKGYHPRNYNTSVLTDYEAWLWGKYPDLDFRASFELLRKHGIGGDILGEREVDSIFLKEHCGLSAGLAVRICNNYKEWLLEPEEKDQTNESFDNDLY